jgi:hypothetical protein
MTNDEVKLVTYLRLSFHYVAHLLKLRCELTYFKVSLNFIQRPYF